MAFDNVNILYQNVSNGPDSGRVYTIDHTSDSLIVKTNPGGSVVNTIPIDTNVQNEILELEYDGYYFYTLSKTSTGILINKWVLNSTGTLLQKLFGAQNEIILNNTFSRTYSSEAFAIHIYNTVLQNPVSVGATTVNITSVTDISIFDSIYLGPSTANLGKREAFTVIGISGNTITLNRPTLYAFGVGDEVIYRKNMYIFNNFAGIDPNGGSLIIIDQFTGSIIAESNSNKWSQVSAASSYNGYLWFSRNSQLYQYKPIGANIGFNNSLLLNNIKSNKNDIIKVYDMIISNISVQKLQTEKTSFNTLADQFVDEVGANSRYQIEEEFLAPNFKSISVDRTTNSVLLGDNKSCNFIVTALDQYNIPVFLRNLTVSDDNIYGFITAGLTTITTNTSGQGITSYNSGIPLVSDLVSITVRDVLSQIPFKFPVEQLAFIDNSNYIEQKGDLISKAPLEQKTLTSDLELVQSSDLSTVTFIDQVQSIQFSTFIDQYTYLSKTFINQTATIVEKSFIDQKPPLIEEITLNQYIYLLFALPKPFSIKNPVDTNILVRIIGIGNIPLNTNTLVFKVNGIDITDQLSITPFGGGLELVYNPTVDFEYGSTVSVYIEIQDTDGPPNTVTTEYTFGIVDDFIAPVLIEVFPANNSLANSQDTVIYAIIQDNQTDIDFNSLEMYVEGIKVVPEIISLGNKTYQIVYNTKCKYLNDKDIDINLRVADYAGNLLNTVWDFRTSEGSDVLFINKYPKECQVLVPIDSSICLTALGQENGIKIDKSTFSLNGKDTFFVLKPKVYRTK